MRISDSRKCFAALSTFERDRAFPVIFAIIFAYHIEPPYFLPALPTLRIRASISLSLAGALTVGFPVYGSFPPPGVAGSFPQPLSAEIIIHKLIAIAIILFFIISSSLVLPPVRGPCDIFSLLFSCFRRLDLYTVRRGLFCGKKF